MRTQLTVLTLSLSSNFVLQIVILYYTLNKFNCGHDINTFSTNTNNPLCRTFQTPFPGTKYIEWEFTKSVFFSLLFRLPRFKIIHLDSFSVHKVIKT